MNSVSALNYKEDVSFSFSTSYKDSEITFSIISDKDRYTVLHNDKIIGHIKLGDIRHTWYVVDSNFPAPYLVDAIGNGIEARFQTNS